MIIGIGTDICDARRIEAAISRHQERFIRRVFTANERAYAASATHHRRRILRYANRFAAKEAYVKALGASSAGLSWQDIEVQRDSSGAPSLHLLEPAKQALHARNATHAHLSLSDEWPYCLAFVTLSA